MSHKSYDGTAKGIANSTEEASQQRQRMALGKTLSTQSVRSISDADSQAEKNNKSPIMANKNQAMGDTQSDAEPGKSPSPTTSPHTVNNSGMQKQPTTPKFDVKSINPKTHQTRALPDNTRRGIDGIFYMGRGHRGVINSSSRPFSFTPRAIWHPQPNNTNVRRSEASGNLIQHASGVAAAASDPAANGGGNNQNAGDCVRTPKTVRSPVTRTFLNAALRGGRNWRGNAAAAAARSNQNNTARTDSSSRQVNTARQVTFSESTTQVSSAEPTIVEAQLPGIKREPRQRQNNYPLLYVSASGTISVVLEKDLIVEMSVDRAIRVSCVGKFAAACNENGTAASLLHKKARILHNNEKIFCNFGHPTHAIEKEAVIGSQGVLFTMSHLNEAYLVSSSTLKGTLPVTLGRLLLPSLDSDFTAYMFYSKSLSGSQFVALCNEIVHEARYGTQENGCLIVTVNGIYIKQDEHGDLEVKCRPRYINCSPTSGTIHLHTTALDIAVQDSERAYVKHGLKRVHVSRSGMVVSDGNCITSMDHLGRIISSS